MIPGSVRPIRMNAKPSSEKITICHAAVPSTRVSDESTRGARRPRYRPAVTDARTPETPRCSAGR